MLSLVLIAALTVQDIGQEAAAERPGHIGATWAATPYFPVPPALEEAGGEGGVRLTCIVTAEGRAQDCVAADETPEGFGIGGTALAASPNFRFNSATQDGAAVDDVVSFTARFKVTGRMPPPDGDPVSPEMQRAIAVVDRLGFTSGFCSPHLDQAERERLEVGLAQYSADRRRLPVFDQILFGGFGRGKESAMEDPQDSEYCRPALAYATSRFENASEEIATVEATFPPSRRRR